MSAPVKKKAFRESAVAALRYIANDNISLQGDTVGVMVGERKRRFLVHESVFCSSSEFFKTGLKKEWKEGQEWIWLYTKEIHSKSGEDAQGYRLLAELYVIGEKILDKRFQVQVINAFVCAAREVNAFSNQNTIRHPSAVEVDIVYQGTPPGSPARRLMVEIYVCWVHGEALREEKVAHNQDFLLDFAASLLDHVELDDADGALCAHHTHGEWAARGEQ